jgi:hypothetical protein
MPKLRPNSAIVRIFYQAKDDAVSKGILVLFKIKFILLLDFNFQP